MFGDLATFIMCFRALMCRVGLSITYAFLLVQAYSVCISDSCL